MTLVVQLGVDWHQFLLHVIQLRLKFCSFALQTLLNASLFLLGRIETRLALCLLALLCDNVRVVVHQPLFTLLLAAFLLVDSLVQLLALGYQMLLLLFQLYVLLLVLCELLYYSVTLTARGVMLALQLVVLLAQRFEL